MQKLLLEKGDDIEYKRGVLAFMAEKLHFLPRRIVDAVTKRLMAELPPTPADVFDQDRAATKNPRNELVAQGKRSVGEEKIFLKLQKRGHNYWDQHTDAWKPIALDPLVESAYSSERNKVHYEYKESVDGPAPSLASDDGISLGKLSKESSIEVMPNEMKYYKKFGQFMVPMLRKNQESYHTIDELIELNLEIADDPRKEVCAELI